jgi:hypothetical protein
VFSSLSQRFFIFVDPFFFISIVDFRTPIMVSLADKNDYLKKYLAPTETDKKKKKKSKKAQGNG